MIYPASGDFRRATIDWHADHGFVVFCFENETSWGYFLVRGEVRSHPSVEVVLGGQAMERWPSELFVPDYLAAEALAFLLETGRRKPDLLWVRTDQFLREVVWEGRAARSAREQRRGRGDA